MSHLSECQCGNPDDPNKIHYNKMGYKCTPAVDAEGMSDEEQRFLTKAFEARSQAEVMMAEAYGPGGGVLSLGEMTKRKELLEKPAVWVERVREDAVTYEIRNIPNDQAQRIVQEVLPKVLELYLNKSKDYDGNVMAQLNLGPKASFVDLWRKVGKLKGALWDDRKMVGEQADEILMDLVGHVLIILDEMR